MARLLRTNRPGAWFHVAARGCERKALFREDRERRHWLELLPDLNPLRIKILGLDKQAPPLTDWECEVKRLLRWCRSD